MKILRNLATLRLMIVVKSVPQPKTENGFLKTKSPIPRNRNTKVSEA
jgi:hypothetical protein